ncbi:MAG: discoidin domain-containing protein [Fimbriimonadia bacterium]|jgi:hypothetical protein
MLAFLLAFSASVVAQSTLLLDDFEDLSPWKSITSEGVSLRISHAEGRTGNALRMEYDFQGRGGFVIAEKRVSLPLPENYEFSFWIRGVSPANNLEFKLGDESGANVWWNNQIGYEFPTEWKQVRLRKRHIRFAWGPRGGGDLKTAATLQFVVAAYTGGKGEVLFDDLQFRELPPVRPYAGMPVVSASSEVRGFQARSMAGAGRGWRSTKAGEQWVAFDFGEPREFGGLVLRWDEQRYPTRFRIEVSDDGRAWSMLEEVAQATGGTTYHYLPDSEARHLRIAMLEGPGDCYHLNALEVRDLLFGDGHNAFFGAMAKDQPLGRFPRTIRGEAGYWTVVGAVGGHREALISEDGAVELDKHSFSLEPMLFADGKLWTWADAQVTQGLDGDTLPLPLVTRHHGSLELRIAPFMTEDGSETLCVSYEIANRSPKSRKCTLYVTIRPFQVNPPYQTLNVIGGATPIRELSLSPDRGLVNDSVGLVSIPSATRIGTTPFHAGDITKYLVSNALPESMEAADSFGFASAAFAYDLDLGPWEHRTITLVSPGSDKPTALHTQRDIDLQRMRARAAWRAKEKTVAVWLPDAVRHYERLLKANLAYIQVNRDGPGVQPGSRSYERSWMRDGALTSAALLRWGCTEEVRQFIEWFASHIPPSGAVPCVVDRRGADPVPEHDSHGQFLYIVAEYYRFTKDQEFLTRMYPTVRRVVEHIVSLRAQRMTPEFLTEERRAYYGLVPESISHEGYSAKPMHSYWDCFFIARGLRDAVEIARALGKRDDVERWAQLATDFGQTLRASLELTIQRHGIDYVPGCVELGDFDPTSTAIGVFPCAVSDVVPAEPLARTFDRYMEFHRDRAAGRKQWEIYTPYEIRIASALLLMGRRDEAHEILDFFCRHVRPPAWLHWAEVVRRDPRQPGFIGDMPHTWVGSEFVKFVRNLLVYEDYERDGLVLGAGILATWFENGQRLEVRGLPTHFGKVAYRVTCDGDAIVFTVSEAPATPGGIVVVSPFEQTARAVVNGLPAKLRDNGVTISGSAEVRFWRR